MPMRKPRGWERTRARVLARDDRVCWLCGGDGADSADHVVPRVMGGDHKDSNLRAAHKACNAARGAPGHDKRQGKRHTMPSATIRDWF